MKHTSAVLAFTSDLIRMSSSVHAQSWAGYGTFEARKAPRRFRHPTACAEGEALTHAVVLLLALLASTAARADGVSTDINRFTGNARLIAPLQQSADQQYTLKAELTANTTQQMGRFALTARLVADANTTDDVCGTASDLIFADGFEN